jgi:ankyrin repeat protein
MPNPKNRDGGLLNTLLFADGVTVPGSAAQSAEDDQLLDACRTGDVDKVHKVLGCKDAAEADESSGRLCRACAQDDPTAVKLLIEAGETDLDQIAKNGATALHIACQRGHNECVRLLIEAGCNLDSATRNGNTPLGVACMSGQTGIAQMLVKAGADRDGTTRDSITLLLIACLQGHVSIALLVLEAWCSIGRCSCCCSGRSKSANSSKQRQQ